MHFFSDLKYENILFENTSPKAQVKIIDFGLSKMCSPDSNMTDGVGTIFTMAPQVFEGNYDSQVDLWSVGVISFMLLSSQLPFYGNSRKKIRHRIMKCAYEFEGLRWGKVSDDAKDFVSCLLQKDPTKRPTADEVTKHPFFSVNHKYMRSKSSLNPMEDVPTSIRKFSNYSMLKKLALMIVAHKSSSSELGDLRKAFTNFDKEKNGTISFDEFRSSLFSFANSECQVREMFDAVDVDNTGVIHYTEFLAATIEAHGIIEEERLAEAFDRLDCDDSGFISLSDLRDLFAGELPDKNLKEIIAQVDHDHYNKISYKEFLTLMKPKRGSYSVKSLKGNMASLLSTPISKAVESDRFSVSDEFSTSDRSFGSDWFSTSGEFSVK